MSHWSRVAGVGRLCWRERERPDATGDQALAQTNHSQTILPIHWHAFDAPAYSRPHDAIHESPHARSSWPGADIMRLGDRSVNGPWHGNGIGATA